MLFTKGAESAILPFTTSGEIEKTRLHVDEFALVRNTFPFFITYKLTCKCADHQKTNADMFHMFSSSVHMQFNGTFNGTT